jgi:hypothetical protein
MEAFLLLADAANADTGSSRVDLLGAGWSITGPNVPPAAISAFLRAPWGELSGEIQFRLRLVDAADQDVRPFADSDQPLSFDGAFTVSEATQLDGMRGKIPLNAAFWPASRSGTVNRV